VTWASQKQKVVALSSCEAVYIVAALGACQGVWLSRLIAEMLGGKVQKFRLLVDNQSAIELAKNHVFHDRSKHIDTMYHYIGDCIEKDVLEVDHVRTDEQVVDILTKPLGRIKFVEFRLKLGVVPVYKD
jgi:hypothetical protein